MGLFDGYQRQLAAMPRSAPPPMAAPRRGLFGGRGQQNDIGLMERIAMAGQVLGGNGETLPGMLRARRQEIEQQQARTAIEDRLRAALSPADGPMGSGTGAAPDIQQQMAALDEARLLNPQVAEQFAPVVQSRRMDEMTRALPLEQRLAITLAPESAGQSFASQFKDETLSEGSIRTRGGQTVAAAPVTDRFDDRFGTFNPLTGETTYSQPRGPTYDEITRRTDPVNVAPGGQMRDREGNLIAEGAGRVFSAADGVDLVTDAGQPIYQNTPNGGGRNGASNFDATTRGALQAARNEAAAARARASDAARFVELNRQAGTGLGAQLLGPVAGLDPRMAEMRAISARLIPQERQPGSGSSSDRDISLYARAVLDVDKPGPVNQAMASVIQAQAQRDADYAAFLDEYASQNGNLNGAQEDWQAYANANPLFTTGANGLTAVVPEIQPWREFMGYGERQRGGRGGQQSGGVVTVSSPAQAAALPPGTRYRTPQGQEYIR